MVFDCNCSRTLYFPFNTRNTLIWQSKTKIDQRNIKYSYIRFSLIKSVVTLCCSYFQFQIKETENREWIVIQRNGIQMGKRAWTEMSKITHCRRGKKFNIFSVFSLLVMIWQIVVNINRILKKISTKAFSFKKLRLFFTYWHIFLR